MGNHVSTLSGYVHRIPILVCHNPLAVDLAKALATELANTRVTEQVHVV